MSCLFVAVMFTGCAGSSERARDIERSFSATFPEARFAVSCSDDLGPDSSSDYDCDVLWSARDRTLNVRGTYEWQKRFQRHDLKDYRLSYDLMPGIISDGRLAPLDIRCRDVTPQNQEYPSFSYKLAYPESRGPPGANFASTVDEQVRNFRRHRCRIVAPT